MSEAPVSTGATTTISSVRIVQDIPVVFADGVSPAFSLPQRRAAGRVLVSPSVGGGRMVAGAT